MAVFFLQTVCLLVMLIGFGSIGIRKRFGQNPKVRDAVTDGIVSRINRMFR